ncbi:transmembrane protein 177 [Dendroctonus ponderosae]
MAHLRTKEIIQKNWFLTEKGQNASLFAATFSTTAVLMGHILPHTILLSKYKNFVRLYSKGIPVPVPDVLVKRFNKALDLLQIDEYEKPRFQPFMACGFDAISLGTYGRFGVHVGIPVNFQFESEDSIDKSNILVNQNKVVWEMESGKQLLKALVMPEEAQLFAMAREIKMRDSLKFFIDTGYAFLACSLTYLGSTFLNKRFDLLNKPRQVRFLGYTIIALFNLGNYIMCTDLVQTMYEENVDAELKELDPIFAEGGRQFYSHILERNKALRDLMGKEGEAMFTVLGNENTLIRSKHLPIVQRLEYFQTNFDMEDAA